MTVTLYKNASDKAVLSKSLTTVKTLSNVHAKQPLDILQPQLVLNVPANFDVNSFNYLYISELKRYYYVSAKSLTAGQMLNVSCDVDVLNTFKNSIKNVTGTVDRQENMFNGYLLDNRYKALNYKQITTKAFPNSVNDDSLVLITVG